MERKKVNIKRRKKNKKSPRRKSSLFKTILIIFTLLLLIYNLYIHFYRNRSMTLMNPSSYSSVIKGKALVIRDEVVYNTVGSVKNAGQKLSVGVPLETIQNYNNTTGYNLDSLQQEIKKLEDILDNYTEIKLKREEISEEKMNQLINEIDEKNYQFVHNWYDENFNHFSLTEDQIFDRLSRLKIQNDIITKQGKDVVALNAGVLVNGLDFYENILSYDTVANMDNDYFFSERSLSNLTDKKDGYKIINNLSYILRITIPTEKIYKAYEIGSSIIIEVGDNSYKGVVKSLTINESETIINGEFSEGFSSFEGIRALDLSVINYETDAYEIPKSAFISKEGQDGVLIRQASGVVAFMPVQILSNEGPKYIIDAGKNGYIKIKDKDIRTLESYNEVLLNPSATKEGELIN